MCERIEGGLDLEESIISPSDWETQSWLEYSFKRDIVSVPSSLNNSWVVLDANTTNHLLQSTTPHDSIEQLQHLYSSTAYTYTSLDETSYTSRDSTSRELQCETKSEMESALLTSTPKQLQEGSLTVAELGKEMVPSSQYSFSRLQGCLSGVV